AAELSPATRRTATATASQRCTTPVSQGPAARSARQRVLVQLDAVLLQVIDPAGEGGPPGVQVTGEVVAIAVLVGVLEFVERTIFRIQKGPVTGQEVFGDHLVQGHGANLQGSAVCGPTVDHPGTLVSRSTG